MMPIPFSPLGIPVSDLINALPPSKRVMPWYCDLPTWASDRFESCIATAEQQKQMMAANFGPAADPIAKQAAVEEFGAYLEETGYEPTIARLKQEDVQAAWSLGIPTWAWYAAGLGIFALVAFSAGGPRRYGR